MLFPTPTGRRSGDLSLSIIGFGGVDIETARAGSLPSLPTKACFVSVLQEVRIYQTTKEQSFPVLSSQLIKKISADFEFKSFGSYVSPTMVAEDFLNVNQFRELIHRYVWQTITGYPSAFDFGR